MALQHNSSATSSYTTPNNQPTGSAASPFEWQTEQFADIRIMRFQIPDWNNLSLGQKELLYYLGQAALCGRDIIFDQNYRYNLAIRRTLEAIYNGYKGERAGSEWNHFMVYLKRVWFSNGIHHHYSTDKFYPDFSINYFETLMEGTPASELPTIPEAGNSIVEFLTPIIFSKDIAPKRVQQTQGVDMVAESANNYYHNLTQKEAEEYYARQANPNDPQPISYGLNSQLVKDESGVHERVWSQKGMYGEAIKHIVYWLQKAARVAENSTQHKTIEALIEYYKTGDLKQFDSYNIQWLGDQESSIDFINGFIETYGDPLGYKASWESVVNFRNHDATKRTQIISSNAQWFEDNSPVDPQFKKRAVRGVSAKVINVTTLGGDCYPATPIGINLPNADWLRKEYGSKSVTIENVIYAYDQASIGTGFTEEFAWNNQEIERAKQHGFLAGVLHTDLHECLGHGSGQLAPGVKGDELRNYGAVLEEVRADLFALYYIMDEKMLDLDIIPSLEVAKAEYDGYIRNGLLTQLTRIEFGNKLEQAHMRNRQLVASWCYKHGRKNNVIEKKVRNGKTYFTVNDYQALRQLFASLLKEVQRIKSTGDYESGRSLVEDYGVNIDQEIHAEMLERFAKLNIAPYGGFVNPRFYPAEKDGQVADIELDYTESYTEQMLRYSKEYSYLPTSN